MWLTKSAKFLEKGLSPVVPVIGNIGSIAIAVMMFLTVVDIEEEGSLTPPYTALTRLARC